MPEEKDYRRFVTEILDWAKYNSNHTANKYRRCYKIMGKQVESDIINILQEEPRAFSKTSHNKSFTVTKDKPFPPKFCPDCKSAVKHDKFTKKYWCKNPRCYRSGQNFK